MINDFTLHLPRAFGFHLSLSLVRAPRAPKEPRAYAQRVPGGLEVRLGGVLLYAESHKEAR